MDCPFCKKEMKDGYVHSASPFLWSPNKIKHTMLPIGKEEGRFGVKITWATCFVRGYYCDGCERVVLDLDAE